jgi:hypothetical protein
VSRPDFWIAKRNKFKQAKKCRKERDYVALGAMMMKDMGWDSEHVTNLAQLQT